MPSPLLAAAAVLTCLSHGYEDDWRYRQYPYPNNSTPPAIHYIHQGQANQYINSMQPAPVYPAPPPSYYQQPPRHPGGAPPGSAAPPPPGGARRFDSAAPGGPIPRRLQGGSFTEFSDTFAEEVQKFVAAQSKRTGGVFQIRDEASGQAKSLKFLRVLPATIVNTAGQAVGCVEFETVDGQEKVDLDFRLTKEDWDWSVVGFQSHADAPVAAVAAETASVPKAKAPAGLTAQVSFSEPSGNQRLDGGETASITVKVSNAGPGPAYRVQASAKVRASIAGLKAPAPVSFGDLKAGQAATRVLAFAAQDDVSPARASVLLEIKEANGFDGDPIIVEFETRPYEPPKLELAGLTLGGSGIVKAGEPTPLTLTLRNTGAGAAEAVTVSLVPGSPDIFLSGETQAALGALAPGQAARTEFEFFVKKRYSGGASLPLAVSVKEARGRYGFGPRSLALTLGQAAPSLKLAYEGKESAPHSARPADDVDVPPASKMAQDPEAFAVVVGVEKYRDLPAVDYAARDAQAMRAYLTESMGFLPSNVVLLQNERATLTDLATYLGPWLEDRVNAKSRVFVYFSGHGAPDPKTGESYLVPYDGNPQYAQTKAFPVRRLYETLAGLPAKNVIVALDSCFSGVGKRSVIAKGMRPLVSVKSQAAGENTVVLTASGGDQVSSSYPEGQHGLLTYFLLKGLQGKADADGDGRITTSELYSYLRPAVENEARRQHVEQTPTLTPEPRALGARAHQVWLMK